MTCRRQSASSDNAARHCFDTASAWLRSSSREQTRVTQVASSATLWRLSGCIGSSAGLAARVQRCCHECVSGWITPPLPLEEACYFSCRWLLASVLRPLACGGFAFVFIHRARSRLPTACARCGSQQPPVAPGGDGRGRRNALLDSDHRPNCKRQSFTAGYVRWMSSLLKTLLAARRCRTLRPARRRLPTRPRRHLPAPPLHSRRAPS